jgi:DNA-binding response OmpR family regulator
VHQPRVIALRRGDEDPRKTAARARPLRDTGAREHPDRPARRGRAEIVGLLTDFLAVEGFGVVAADDARAAIAALGRHEVDCVLLDVMLPGRVGLRRVPAHPRALRRAAAVPQRPRRGRRQAARPGPGRDDYIVKSATPAEVVARVKAVLRRSANGRSTSRRRYGRLEVDLAAHEILADGRPSRSRRASSSC